MKEVEIIKIGEILGSLTGDIGSIKPMILIITDAGEIVDYYLDIFLRNVKGEFKEKGVGIQKTTGGIISQTPRLDDIIKGKVPKGKGIKGIEKSEPVVGQIYELKDGWHTSRVDRIIEDCVLITKNSVYAIHSLQNNRNRKLNDLGIC